MSTPERVWVVEMSDYDNHSIHGVFATRELAEDYVARLTDGADLYINEMPFVVAPVEELPVYFAEGLHGWRGDRPEGWRGQTTKHGTQYESSTAAELPEINVRIYWYNRHEKNGVLLHVDGIDEAAVNAAFDKLWAEVKAGRTPE